MILLDRFMEPAVEWVYSLLSKYPYTNNRDDYAFGLTMLILISLLIIAIMVFIGWCIYGAVNRRKSTYEECSGVLIDKAYKGSTSSSGTGVAMLPNSSGGVSMGVISTSSSSPEEFLFFVKSGHIWKITVDMQRYYSYNIGDKVKFVNRIGGLSKKIIETSIK